VVRRTDSAPAEIDDNDRSGTGLCGRSREDPSPVREHSMYSARSFLPLYLSLVSAVLLTLHLGAQQTAPGGELDALKWRHIGPVGNRVAAVAGVPGDPNVYYAGAASGGLWKTSDGGTYWEPVFDGQTAQSIGAIA